MPSQSSDPHKQYSTLSFRDLVDARDFYHRQLMRKKNVVGTALGRYLVRKPGVNKHEKKTLSNSEVKNYSWPCILVFVKEWIPKGHFGGKIDAFDFVPPLIEMSDGRVVPLCVVEASPELSGPAEAVNPKFPGNWIGGGYPVIADVQGEEHVASIGGMVTDGHLVYALTNRHVTGETGEVVYSVLGGEKVAIGKSSSKQINRMPFERAYPGWPGKGVFVHMDIGLIEVEDATRWTAQIYGIGTTGPMVDLSTENISLRLLDSSLQAYGCASGHMSGRILGMFYRYQSVSGSEYIADFLIGPDGDKPLDTRRGDSGTLWLLQPDKDQYDLDEAQKEPPKPPMPLAVQWGGQVLTSGNGAQQGQPYALATSLSTICRILNIDYVQDWNIGHPEYWGAVGHYTIAEKACEIIKNAQLKSLMQRNLTSITFPVDQIDAKNMKGLSLKDFVPLADVPDMVWKVGPNKRGGMTSPEHSNHFADMDKKDSNNNTLLDLCEQSDKNIDPAVWMTYYNDPKVKDQSKGLLPFRCWQIYNEMVDAVKKGDAKRFVCAAGILSHYVGDACQPLHISYMFNGDPADTETVQVTDKKTGVTKNVEQPVAKGVHSAYEDGLVNFHTPEILAALQKEFAGKTHGLALNKDHGFGAAKAVVGLMQQTFNDIQPKKIVDAFVPIRKLKPKDIAQHLWDEFGKDTVKVMAAGARTLSMLWDSAWTEGGGSAKMAATKAITPGAFKSLYIRPGFLPSCTLAQIDPVLKGSATGAPATKKAAVRKKPTAKKKAPAKKK